MMVAPAEQLAEAAAAMLQFFRESARLDNGELAFPNADMYLVRPDEALYHRLKLSAILLRSQYDAKLAAGSTKHLKEQHGAGGMLFPSGEALMTGYIFGDAYLAPLLACLSPFMWGMISVRSSGILISSFGRSVVGTLGDASELLQTVPLRGSMASRPNPQLSSQAIESGVEWWVGKVSHLWGILGDLKFFKNAHGTFDAQAHFNAAITIENCFRSLTSVLTADRDGVARELAFHAYIDTYEKLSGRNSVDLLSPSNVKKILARVEAALPETCQDMLLYAARRAESALDELSGGFYTLDSSPGSTLTVNDGVRSQELSLESATARLIRALRNSKHGVGGARDRDRINASLLAQHSGEVPHDLGLLAWLLHLDLLNNVDRIAPRLAPST
jgi:hypothetical protein